MDVDISKIVVKDVRSPKGSGHSAADLGATYLALINGGTTL
jgi:hypothetical protein